MGFQDIFFYVLFHHHLGLYFLDCCSSLVCTEMLGMPPTAQTDHSYRCIQGNHRGDTHLKFVAVTENAASVTHSRCCVFPEEWGIHKQSLTHSEITWRFCTWCISISGLICVGMRLSFLSSSAIFIWHFLQYLQKFEFAEYLLVRLDFFYYLANLF